MCNDRDFQVSRIKWPFLLLLGSFADYIFKKMKNKISPFFKTGKAARIFSWLDETMELKYWDKIIAINIMQILKCETPNRWFRHFQMLSKLISFHWLIWQ